MVRTSAWKLWQNQRYIFLETGDSAWLPAQLAGDGDKGIEIVYGKEKIYFVLGRLEQPRQNKNLLNQHDKPNEPTKKELFLMYSLRPHLPQFQQSAGATPL